MHSRVDYISLVFLFVLSTKFSALWKNILSSPLYCVRRFARVSLKQGVAARAGSHAMCQLEHTLDRAQPPSPLLLCVHAVLSYVCHAVIIPGANNDWTTATSIILEVKTNVLHL